MCCGKCKSIFAGSLIIFGILFLLRDLSFWNFWNIQWWTVLFLLVGFKISCKKLCKECATECCEQGSSSKPKRKRK